VYPTILEVPHIGDFSGFLRALDVARMHLRGLQPFWRGHAHIDWPLTPEVFRTPPLGSHYPEVTLIRTFMGKRNRGLRSPPHMMTLLAGLFWLGISDCRRDYLIGQ
jgi:hypothetical protein